MKNTYHVLHETKDIKARVSDCLHKASFGSLARCHAHSIALYALVCQMALRLGQPLRGEREVGQKIHGDHSNAESNCAFDTEYSVSDLIMAVLSTSLHKKPLPSRQTMYLVEGAEGGGGNQSGEGCGHDIA